MTICRRRLYIVAQPGPIPNEKDNPNLTTTAQTEPDLFAAFTADNPTAGRANPSAAASAPAETVEPDIFAGQGAGIPTAAPQPQQGLTAAPGASTAAPSATPVAGSATPPSAGSPGDPNGSAPQGGAGGGSSSSSSSSSSSFDQPAASPIDTAEDVGLGLLKGAFATKDFLATGAGMWGLAPAEKDRSAFRQQVDAESAAETAKWGIGSDLTQGIGQVALGLIGAGKIAAAVKIGGAVTTTAADTLAAVASFEPHAQNFANLAQQVPGLSGPITQFFASSPNDSDAWGYAKNALTSLGVSTALAGAFMASAGMLRALSGGDSATIEAAGSDLEQALADHVTAMQQPDRPPSQESPSPLSAGGGPLSSSGAEEGGGQAASPSSSLAPSPLRPFSVASDTGVPRDATTISEPAASGSLFVDSDPAASPLASFRLDDDAFLKFIADAQSDQDALMHYGSWDSAIANGHEFGAEQVPWHLIGGTNAGQAETALDAFLSRSISAIQDQLDAAKGGAVETDAMNAAAVQRRVQLWGQDQSTLLGHLQLAGDNANELRANMEAGFTVASKQMQDAWTLASRINLGDYSGFSGSRDGALAALKANWLSAMQTYGAANSILSNAARTVRGAGSAFRLDPMAIRNMASLNPEDLASALSNTSGDLRALSKLAGVAPTVWQNIGEGLQLYLVNNLISNPVTHAVIFGSNLWQAGMRPAMRAAGSIATGTFDSVGREALGQYRAMGTVSHPSLSAPRGRRSASGTASSLRTTRQWGEPMGAQQRRPQGSKAPAALCLHRAWLSASRKRNTGHGTTPAISCETSMWPVTKAGTLPTRMVGLQDELVKQVRLSGHRASKSRR